MPASRSQVEAAVRLIDELLEDGHRGLYRSRRERSLLGMEVEPLGKEVSNLKRMRAKLQGSIQ